MGDGENGASLEPFFQGRGLGDFDWRGNGGGFLRRWLQRGNAPSFAQPREPVTVVRCGPGRQRAKVIGPIAAHTCAGERVIGRGSQIIAVGGKSGNERGRAEQIGGGAGNDLLLLPCLVGRQLARIAVVADVPAAQEVIAIVLGTAAHTQQSRTEPQVVANNHVILLIRRNENHRIAAQKSIVGDLQSLDLLRQVYLDPSPIVRKHVVPNAQMLVNGIVSDKCEPLVAGKQIARYQGCRLLVVFRSEMEQTVHAALSNTARFITAARVITDDHLHGIFHRASDPAPFQHQAPAAARLQSVGSYVRPFGKDERQASHPKAV
ncbi:MAG TPA: hypothetical protein PK867_05855, partial [Pirellulales bacterium]|nr:hypothetical protein [Pirellulales bacterium]